MSERPEPVEGKLLEPAKQVSPLEGLSALNEALHEVVVGIVDLAKTSPLAALGDLSQLRRIR